MWVGVRLKRRPQVKKFDWFDLILTFPTQIHVSPSSFPLQSSLFLLISIFFHFFLLGSSHTMFAHSVCVCSLICSCVCIWVYVYVRMYTYGVRVCTYVCVRSPWDLQAVFAVDKCTRALQVQQSDLVNHSLCSDAWVNSTWYDVIWCDVILVLVIIIKSVVMM
jgi:hypothetical protein